MTPRFIRLPRWRARLGAGAALVVLGAVLVSTPGAAGGHVPDRVSPLAAGAFTPLVPSGTGVQPPTLGPVGVPGSDPVAPSGAFAEPAATADPTGPPAATVPTITPGLEAWPVPHPLSIDSIAPAQLSIGRLAGLRILVGLASWYRNGTTAMRLPRGVHVRVCGPAACVSRSVTDYGPDASIYPGRVVDMMPADFAKVCGCTPARGLVRVTVFILP